MAAELCLEIENEYLRGNNMVRMIIFLVIYMICAILWANCASMSKETSMKVVYLIACVTNFLAGIFKVIEFCVG